MKKPKVIENDTRTQADSLGNRKWWRRDEGDVPGWVLITVMTAGLVVALWSIADGQLKSILTNALHSVGKP
ncbi:unannotated protein [freshwater metagenome]|uniref:Unannotated protein n=1 Tax=freshwater metagenome TaxID=449393 RepID=A0A6J5ZH91_9ZZZZ